MCATAPTTACRSFARTARFVSEHIYEKSTRGTGSVYDLVFSPDTAQTLHLHDRRHERRGAHRRSRATNEVLARFGRPGRQAGQFTALHNIAVDRQGNIFTAEVNTGQRVQKFRRLDPQD